MNTINKIVFFVFLLGLASCANNGQGKDGVILARVKEHYFYFSDIKEHISPGISSTDSLQLVQSLVNSWVRNEILLLHAESNLPDSLKDFTKQMAEYRNSLLLFQFKKRYIEQELDTVISEYEMAKYYSEHLSDFELKESIVQFSFIQMKENSPQLLRARSLFQQVGDLDLQKTKLENFCVQNGVDYFTDDEKWIPFNDVLSKIPLTTYNNAVFLKNNKFIEFKNAPFVYFIYIKDYKVAEEISPLEFERDKIKRIILNKRKLLLIENMESALFERAFQQKNFEIY
ncbi:MAG TPA: hypothetical protein DCG69_01185 [Bacteroidales bacterium]|nr:hypothetical protein [Bacteroidales bacterium]